MIEMAELGDLVLKRIKIVSKIEKITITTLASTFKSSWKLFIETTILIKKSNIKSYQSKSR